MIAKSEEIFAGVWPAMFTPVDDAGEINTKELEKLVALLVKEEVDGLYLLGSTGQGFLFSEKQRIQITSLTLEMVDKRLPVMVQVGALNTEESVRLAKHAYKSGADAISSVGPIYYGATLDMSFEHYRKIASATALPFFPYQIGKAATNDMIAKLLAVPNIAGMKLTTQNLLEISSIHQHAGNEWRLFSGADELICHAAMCGTAGAIGTTYNLLGKIFKSLRQRFLNGEVVMATEFMLEFQALIENVIPFIWTFFRRSMILKHNIDIGKPKPPLLPAHMEYSDEKVMAMISNLESIVNGAKTAKV
jgi:N-acetylneuraminate lyase